MSESVAENMVYYLLRAYPFFKGIQKHNRNKLSFAWYNRLVFMKTGCEIKMTETQSDIILEIKIYLKRYSTMKKD